MQPNDTTHQLQARFLSWEHLSRDQIAAIRAAPKQPGARTARQLLQQYVSEQLAEDQLRNDIVLDLYSYALQQGQVMVGPACRYCTQPSLSVVGRAGHSPGSLQQSQCGGAALCVEQTVLCLQTISRGS